MVISLVNATQWNGIFGMVLVFLVFTEYTIWALKLI